MIVRIVGTNGGRPHLAVVAAEHPLVLVEERDSRSYTTLMAGLLATNATGLVRAGAETRPYGMGYLSISNDHEEANDVQRSGDEESKLQAIP